jgi:glucan 1,3-beta-glucosidase
VSANYFPFWELADIDGAADFFYTRFSALVETASAYNKEVIVGETGWASDGVDAAASPATAANAAKYFYDFYTLAEEKDLMYFYFSAFDEPWKLATLEANETVEAYFGLFTQEGVLKELIAAEFDNSTSSLDGSNSATITAVGDADSSSADVDASASSTAADATTSTTSDDDVTLDGTTQDETVTDASSTAADASTSTTSDDATQDETAADAASDDTSASTSTTTTSHNDCAM